MKRVVLISGCSGFIGTHLAHHFRQMGWYVVGMDRNAPTLPFGEFAMPFVDRFLSGEMTDEGFLKTTIEGFKFDLCVHLAGPADVSRSFEQPTVDFREHTLPLLSLLEALRRAGRKVNTLLVSSAAVYGNPDRLPISENDRISPISPYGFGKYHQELIAAQYGALHDIPLCCARVFSTYGPGLRRLAVWEIARRALNGVPSVLGAGDETRDYLYIADVAKALAHVGTHAEFIGETINVASGRETSIRDLATHIFRTVGLPAAPQFSLGGEAGKPKRWCANVDKLTALGFIPDFSLESGLNRTLAWVRQNA